MTATAARVSIGDALRAKRLTKHLSARAASVAAGLSESYLGKIEKGEVSDVSVRILGRLASVLDLTDREVALIVRWESVREERLDNGVSA